MAFDCALNSIIRYHGLKHTPARVYQELYDLIRNKGIAQISYEGISYASGLSRRAVANAIKRLKELKLITWITRYGINQYEVPLANLTHEQIIKQYKLPPRPFRRIKIAVQKLYTSAHSAWVPVHIVHPNKEINKYKDINNSQSTKPRARDEDDWTKYEQVIFDDDLKADPIISQVSPSENIDHSPAVKNEQFDNFVITKEHIDLAKQKGLDVHKVLDKFLDYNRRAGNVLFNASAAFLGWLKREQNIKSTKQSSEPSGMDKVLARFLDRITKANIVVPSLANRSEHE